MRILWVKAGKLLPVDTGGRIRSYHLLRELAGRHDVTLLTYYAGARDEPYEREIAGIFPRAVTLSTQAPETAAGRALEYGMKLWSSAPYAVTKFTTVQVRERVASLLDGQRCDVAVCDFLSASLNFPAASATPVVLFQHNVESILWRRQAREERHPAKRVVFGLEAAKMARYESRTVARFAHVIAVSETDRQAMTAMTSPDRISVVPTGCDTSRFAPSGRPPSDELVLFVGSMDWEPNIDGIEYFCRAVWPRIRSARPEARFRIVGRNPGPSITRLAGADIEVTGSVPSVLEHLHEASVVVVPLRIGGGTRLKIYEAMAAGKAVVSTTIGAEGLDVHDGRDILLADDPDALAGAVIRLLVDGADRQRIETAALDLARRYDWRNVSLDFERVLERAAGTGGIRLHEPDPVGAPA
jgi:glycosyltransferase involved in cell wall biosynthesis